MAEVVNSKDAVVKVGDTTVGRVVSMHACHDDNSIAVELVLTEPVPVVEVEREWVFDKVELV